MNNKQTEENLNELNLIFEVLGFTDTERKDHIARIMAVIFASASAKLDKVIQVRDKTDFPEMTSLEDFYNYYGQYVDREMIDKVIKEGGFKSFTGYFSAIADQLPK